MPETRTFDAGAVATKPFSEHDDNADVRYPFDLDPAKLLPFSMEIGENPYGRAIEGTYNEPYMS